MRSSRVLQVIGLLAVAFGLVTIRAGADVLFRDGASHAGPVVPFVVWFNFLAAFGYVAVGVALVRRARWSDRGALGLAALTMLVFVAFGAHVAGGGAYAARTVAALAVRSGFWIAAGLIARASLRRLA